MTMDITLDRPVHRPRPGTASEPGRVVSGRLRAGGGPDAQEVRPHAGPDRRRHGAGRPVPTDLPLCVRRGGGASPAACPTSTSWCRASW